MTAQALLFTLAAIGISETVYLIRKRKAEEKPVCVIGGECTKVLSSKYNTFFGIHNDVLGLLFYLAVAAATAFLVIGWPEAYVSKLAVGVKLAVYGALLMSAYFVFLQWRVIKAWCFWCLMSAFTVACMTLIVFISSLIVL